MLVAVLLSLLALGAALAQVAAAQSPSGPPVISSMPAVKGSAMDGKKLKAGAGKWSGSKPFTYSYAWQLCNAAGGECATIPSASSSTLITDSQEVGHTVRAVVTAKNADGTSAATSAPSAAVASAAPKRKKAPTITGTAQDGQLLTAVDGTWKGTQPLSLTYQWQSCQRGPCSPISGATTASYRATTAQLGQKLRVLVTATNAAGSATAASKRTAIVVPGPPVALTPPSIAGEPVVEQTLTAEPGSWGGTGPFTYSYQWLGCNLLGECEDISGATGSSYTVGPLQAANSIEVTVTATNSLGSSSATSPKTSLVGGLLPANTVLPSITGLLQDGGLLSALTGTWSGTEPLSFSYVWEICDSAGANCEQISGAFGATLGLISGEVGKSVRVIVTATNSAGSSSATSEPTSLINALLPANTVLPSIGGLLQDGGLLSALTGSWSGTEPLSFSYVWEACDSAGANCEQISGALGTTLSLISGEVGKTIRVAVTATNSAGSSTATSPLSSPITGLLPTNLGLPSITGLLEDGGLLTAGKGSWSGTEPLSFSYAWELCNAAGGGCETVSGALGTTLALVSGDVGNTVRLIVTATNQTGSTSATSEPTSLIGALLPSNTALPTITGVLQDGASLAGLHGSWAGTEPLSFGYQWQQCNATGGDCKNIGGATGAALGLISGEVGSTVRLLVTATNSAGSSTAASQPTSLIEALLPANTGLPSITGLLQDGSAISALTGSWTGTGPLSYGYQWLLCDASGGSCKEISGATGTTLGLVTGMIGSTVRLVVTATNVGGSTSATSEPTSLVKALLPSNTALPSVSGLLQDGGLLSAVTGSWSGSAPLSYGYQWLLCNASGASCKEVSGATGTTLGLITSMIGSTVRFVVTATNGAGSTSATSEPTGLITALLPSNTSLPSIAGSLIDGSLLTGAKGSWTGSEPSFSYQWLLCNASGGSCKEVSGATGSTLGLITGMIGSTVRLVVTATNGAGSTSATSEPTGLIGALLPSNTALPSVAGTLIDGSLLTGAKGSWKGSEPSFSYQWLLCNASGASCKEVSGATGTALGLITSMIGSTVRLVVTATNGAGSTSATSEPTGLITALLPSNTALPSVTGSLIDGSLLTGAKGSWTGSEPSFSYQWLLCNASGGSCKEVSGATGSTLGLITGMIGSTVRLVVTATNGAGSTSATSAPTGLVAALLPSNTSLPSITGLAEDGSTLSGAKGSWTGSEPSFSYQWLLCNSSGGSCKEVSGATGSTLGLLTSEIGSTVRLLVTATNSAGSTSATSAQTLPILAILPANTVVPSIEGVLQTGQLLTAVVGKWSGSEPITYSYQWQTCGLLGKESECKNLAEAIKSTLKLELLQVNLTLRLIINATNARGSVSKASPITADVLGLGLSPVDGSTAGGTAVKLSSPGVSKATAVNFGSAKATAIEVDSPDEITAVTPPGAEGQVPVTVTTPEGSTHKGPEDMFTYQP